MNKFRVHHIMRTNLYQGYGYSGGFCENMTRMVKWLNENPDEPLLVTTNPDEICKKCPNLKEGKYCVDVTNHVHEKDSELLSPLHIKENEVYTYNELKQLAGRYLTKDVFEESCSNCEWYKQGLCRFEDFYF